MKYDLLKDNRGFTIVEVIASVFIFSVIVTTIGGIFIRSLSIERKNFSAQKVQENSLRALEMMAREIRISRIATADSDCLASFISLIRPSIGTVDYTLISGQIFRKEGTSDAAAITSADINFNKLNFCVDGSASNDSKPTRVTILTQVENVNGIETYTLNLQTTIISRDLSDDFQN